MDKPIGDGSNTSVTTYLRRGEKMPVKQQLQPREGMKICERNNSTNTRVNEEQGGGDAPCAGAEITL